MENQTLTIMLGENDIEEIINGRVITRELPDGNKVIVQQRLTKDVMLPIINNPMRVVNVHEEALRREFMNSMRNDIFKPGC